MHENLSEPVLIVGCGYLGRRLAERYRHNGAAVRGVVRSEESRAVVAAAGLDGLRADLDEPQPPDLLAGGASLFYLVPPPVQGDRDSRLRALLGRLMGPAAPRRIVYVSTTGVYGDCAGDWIDETSPVDPGAARAVRRLDAERALGDWAVASGGQFVVLRVPGIYGPGRLPVERIRQRLPLVRPEEAPFTNRIHVDDLVEACVAAMERGRPGEVYNAADGHPSTMADYFCRIADLTGQPRPPLVSLAEAERVLSPGMLSYQRESRRIGNRKLTEDLGVALRYPTLESGLRACLAEEARR